MTTLAKKDSKMLPADTPMLFHYVDDPEQVETACLRTDVYLPIRLEEVH